MFGVSDMWYILRRLGIWDDEIYNRSAIRSSIEEIESLSRRYAEGDAFVWLSNSVYLIFVCHLGLCFCKAAALEAEIAYRTASCVCISSKPVSRRHDIQQDISLVWGSGYRPKCPSPELHLVTDFVISNHGKSSPTSPAFIIRTLSRGIRSC